MDTQIAEALNVSLDYLVGATDLLFDKNVIKKIQEIQQLDSENKTHLFALMDAFLRDYKAKHKTRHIGRTCCFVYNIQDYKSWADKCQLQIDTSGRNWLNVPTSEGLSFAIKFLLRFL